MDTMKPDVGLAWWSQVFEESVDCVKVPIAVPCIDVSGLGLTAGAGYELGNRVWAELVAMWGDPSVSGDRFEVVSPSATVSLFMQFRLV
jgi:hypothetical protein